MTRRTVLGTLVLAVAGAVAAAVLVPVRWLWEVARLLRPRLDASAPTGALLPDEMETLVAFGEVLVEGRRIPDEARRELAEHIEDRARNTAGYLPLYRTTARWLDRLAGTSFASLDVATRVSVLTRHRLMAPEVRARDYLLAWLLVWRREELAVRELVARDLILGYYRSPAGWALVGYAAFPGRCGSLLRYTRPEA